MSAPVDAMVEVDLSTVDIGDAAGGGVDYTDVNQLISFPANSTAPVTVPVAINDDNIVEADEKGLETTRKPGATFSNYQESKIRWLHELLGEWVEGREVTVEDPGPRRAR